MTRGLFNKLFPTPKYLEMPAVGLDISDQSVKYLELTPKGDAHLVKKFGEKEIPLGIIESGKIKDQKKLEEILRALKVERGVKRVFASLPEEEAFIVRIPMPAMSLTELRGAIELGLEEHVPIPAKDAVFDYEILKQPQSDTDTFDVVVSVMPVATVASYSNALKNAGIELLALEIEAQAIARALTPFHARETTLVVDFGKTRTSFLVTSGHKTFSSSTVNNIGGEDITKAIQKNLKVDYATAEKIKITKGLLHSRRDKELLFSVIPVVSILKDEVAKQFSFWESKTGSHEKEKIERVVLAGGQATLPGLAEYLALSLGVPVELGNVWTNTRLMEVTLPPMTFNQSLRYATAMGLALRNVPR
mgnify:FL=1